MPHRRLVVAPLGLIALLAACGEDSGVLGTADEPRTVEVDMVDIAYEPDSIEVREGETIRFMFANEGAVQHDAFVGDETAQQEHEDEMRAAEEAGDDMDIGDDGDMDGDMDEHSDTDMGGGEEGVTVQPGETGEVTYTFDEPGEMLVGCHEPDHYEADMVIRVDVSS